MAAALVDRLMDGGQVFYLKGPSWRTKDLPDPRAGARRAPHMRNVTHQPQEVSMPQPRQHAESRQATHLPHTPDKRECRGRAGHSPAPRVHVEASQDAATCTSERCGLSPEQARRLCGHNLTPDEWWQHLGAKPLSPNVPGLG